jgi:hypothetical protein
MNTGPWKCRTVDAEENQKQVSLCAPSAWKSQKARFPHSHGPGEPVEKWKSKSRISTFPPGVLYPFCNSKPTQGAWRRGGSLPP